MDIGLEMYCDWKTCTEAAAKHVRYGFLSNSNKEPAVTFHGDYCWRHIRFIEESFTSVEKFAIGECPDGCDSGGMKVIHKP